MSWGWRRGRLGRESRAALRLTCVGVSLLTALVSYLGIGALGATQSVHPALLPPAAAARLGDRRALGSPFFVPSPLIALAAPRHSSDLGKGGRGSYRQETAADTRGELSGPQPAPLSQLGDADGQAHTAERETLLVPITEGTAGPAWPWPTLGTISTAFSPAHPGLDIAAPFGTGVLAVAPGVVTEAQKRAWGLGWFLVLDHGSAVTSTYAHLGGFLVKPGEPIGQGQPIGWVGSTGFSTGPHLHFELRRQGRHLDPSDYLAGEGYGEGR